MLHHFLEGNFITESNSIGAHYVILQIELEEEKSNPAGLAQQNGFWPSILHSLLRLVKGIAKPNTCQRRV
jgi:hypothetical protein